MAKSDDKTKALATQGPIATTQYVEDVDAVELSAGAPAPGYEHQTNQDVAVPFLRILQPLSPQIKNGDPPGAKNGDIYNTSTGEVYDGTKGIYVCVGTTRHAYGAFRDRKKGGGYQGQYEIDSPEVIDAQRASKEFGEYRLQSDLDIELVETFYQFAAYGLEAPDKPCGMAVLTFSSTAIKAYKNWMALVRAHTMQTPDGRKVQPPLFAHCYRLTSKRVDKADNTWWVPVLTPYKDGQVALSMLSAGHPLREMAKGVRLGVDSGAAKVDYSQQERAESGRGEAQGAAPF